MLTPRESEVTMCQNLGLLLALVFGRYTELAQQLVDMKKVTLKKLKIDKKLAGEKKINNSRL